MKQIKYNVPKLEISKEERNASIELMHSIFNVQSSSGDMDAMKYFIYNFISD